MDDEDKCGDCGSTDLRMVSSSLDPDMGSISQVYECQNCEATILISTNIPTDGIVKKARTLH